MKKQITKVSYTNISHLTLRRNLGLLGISLPVVLWVGSGFRPLPSLSAYYYTYLNVVFTGYLFAFGLFLFSYKGYSKKEDETVSDNWLTNWAGILILIVAIVPTKMGDSDIVMAPNGHNSEFWNWIHDSSAGCFLVIMGWLAMFQFTKSNKSQIDDLKRRRNKIYRVCAWVIWILVLFMGVVNVLLEIDFTGVDVFIGESFALFCFGVAWLVKSKALEKYGV